MSWDERKTRLLEKLWVEDGLSAGEIAMRIPGFSRNAVIGKLHRMGLHKKKCLNSQRQRNRNPGASKSLAPYPFVKIKKPVLQSYPLPETPPCDVARVSFKDLKDDMCKWPVGDPKDAGKDIAIFCGAERIPGQPYCIDHLRRAFPGVDAAVRKFEENRNREEEMA